MSEAIENCEQDKSRQASECPFDPSMVQVFFEQKDAKIAKKLWLIESVFAFFASFCKDPIVLGSDLEPAPSLARLY